LAAKELFRQAHQRIKILHKCNDANAFVILLDYLAIRLCNSETFVASPIVNAQVIAFATEAVEISQLHYESCDSLFELAHEFGMIRDTIEEKFEHKTINDMLSYVCFNPGRNIMRYYTPNKTDHIYFGVESNLIAYRVALINMKMYKIPGMMLYVCDQTNADIGSPIWKYANVWNPKGAIVVL